MKNLNRILTTSLSIGASTTFAALAPRASSLPTVATKGNAFYAGNNRFYIRGVDYQPGGSSQIADPIADSAGCARDIKEFTKLGINTVRVYSVDNTANHDSCMNALAAAGIYLVLDVNNPSFSLNRDDPGPSYNDVYLQSVFATIDAFANYTNTLAFFSGNEVINSTTPSTNAAPYVKAVTRDMRQYIKNRGYRAIPVGYSAADVEQNRYDLAQYMNCGTDDERSDFFAFNDYSWCDPSTYPTSGWSQKVALFGNYSIPIFLSEYGCNKGGARHFEEVAALYNSEMTGVYSGGLVYEYSQETSMYGLVTISGSSVSELPDFGSLQKALSGTQPPSGDGGAKSSGSASTCPPASSNWLVSNDNLPAIPDKAKQYMTKGAGKGPGLEVNGPGSQNAGSASTGTATPGSGSASVTASGPSSTSSKKGAAGALQAPIQLGSIVSIMVVIFSSFVGAMIVL